MNARRHLVQIKARPLLGLFLYVGLAVLFSSFISTTAWAQFDKTAWPNKVVTPNIEAVDLQGKTWRTAELLGKVVVLNFWATWCAPCKDELPTLQILNDFSDTQTVVLTINVREPATRAARYMQSTGMTFPVISDVKGDFAKRWGVTVYPTTFLIAPNGQARWRIVGDVDWSGLQANVWLSELRQIASPINVPSDAASSKR